MSLGKRILIPESLWFHTEAVEMRLCGKFSEVLVSAVLFRLVEMSHEKSMTAIQPVNPATESLELLCRAAGLRDSAAYLLAKPTSYWEQANSLTDFRSLSDSLTKLYFRTTRDISGLEDLCHAGKVHVSLKSADTTFGNSTSVCHIHLVEHAAMCFCLYQTFTLNSFIDFSCGHFDLRYTYFRKLAQEAEQCTVSYNDVQCMGISCDHCGIAVSDAVFQDAQQYLFRPEKSEESKFIPSLQGTMRECHFCKKQQSELVRTCSTHEVCEICCTKNFLTEAFSFCPGCDLQLSQKTRNRIEAKVKEKVQFEPYIQLIVKWQSAELSSSICKMCRRAVAEEGLGVCQDCYFVKRQEQVRRSQQYAPQEMPDPNVQIEPYGNRPPTAAAIMKPRSPDLPSRPGAICKTCQAAKVETDLDVCQDCALAAQHHQEDIRRSQVHAEQERPQPKAHIGHYGNRPSTVAAIIKSRSRAGGICNMCRRAVTEEGLDVCQDCASAVQQSPRMKVQVVRNGDRPSTVATNMRPQICRVCKLEFPADDPKYCRYHCECSECAQISIAIGNTKCLYCSSRYNESALQSAKNFSQCIICGFVTLSKYMLETTDSKYICYYCLDVTNRRLLRRPPTPDDEKKTMHLRLHMSVACCARGEGRKWDRLSCDHEICSRHSRIMEQCRICHKPVK